MNTLLNPVHASVVGLNMRELNVLENAVHVLEVLKGGVSDDGRTE